MDYNQDPTKETDTFGTDKHGFTEGDGSSPRSLVRATWLNDVLGSIVFAQEMAGITAIAEDRSQLAKAIKLRSMFTALAKVTRVQPAGGSDNFRAVSTFRNNVAAVGNDGGGNVRMVSSVDRVTYSTRSGSVAGDLTACAVGPTLYVGIGASGLWVTGAVGATTATGTGAFSGGPTMSDIIYDEAHALFLVAASSGLFKSSNGTAWTQIGAVTDFERVAVLPSGRIVAYRPTDDRLYYSDDQATTTMGPLVGIDAAGGSTMYSMVAFDEGLAMTGDDGSGNTDYYYSEDATSIDYSSVDLHLAYSNNRVISLAGMVAILSTSTNRLIVLPNASVSVTPHSAVHIPYDLTARAVGSSFGSYGAASGSADEFIYVSDFFPEIY